MISALDNAKYANATHSNAPQAAHVAAASRAIHSAMPRPSVSKLPARSAPLTAFIRRGNAIAASLVRSFALTLRFIPDLPHWPVNSILLALASLLPRFPSFLCVLCVSSFRLLLFPISKQSNRAYTQAVQAFCKGSPPSTVQQHRVAIGHSRCRHTHSTGANRARVPPQSVEPPALSLLRTLPLPKSSLSTSRRFPRAASRKHETHNKFLFQQGSLPKLAPLPAPAVPAFRSSAHSCAPVSCATPLFPSLRQKKTGQAIVDCAAKEPTPVPGPGGRPCAGKTTSHLPGHALQEFARRANAFCSSAKLCRSHAVPIALLPSTTENNSSEVFRPGFARP